MPNDEVTPRLGLVTVNYGSRELIAQNFVGLTNAAFPLSIVVVDNFSSAEESRALAELCDGQGWSLVALEKNAGFGVGMNVGVAQAKALGCTEFVMLNPDARITDDVLESLADRIRADRGLLLSPRVVKPDGGRWFDGGIVAIREGSTRTSMGSDSSAEGGWLSGACLAVHDDLWTSVGGFDDRYFLYWEDVDLSWRVVSAGGRLAVASDLEVVHSVGGTQPGQGKSSTYVFYNCRNRLLFARTHLTEKQARAWVRSSVRYAYVVLLRGGRRALLKHPFTLISAAIRGTIAGGRRSSASPGRG